MTAPKEILQLVERFREQREAYLNPHYNEAQLRQEFLNPFFEALGWDVDNKQSWSEAYKEVIHEATVKVGIETKAPDYSFRIGGTRKFFLEAKKPSVNIDEDPSPAFQLRRYAWSAKLSLSILSNFAEFAIYDCRIRPVQNDKPSKSRILYITADQYAEHWDKIASIFSKDAVLKGSFDKYAVGKGKKGTAEVDSAFLEEIESWREMLAKNIALRNADLTPRELNFAVQQTIDRIIFLRICEDRGIESYGRLRGLLNGSNIYARLRQLFHDADDRYNSGLFHFRRETGRGEPDSLTLGLEIDDKVLKEILKNLYYPDSPYEFSVLPADILGQVYEQFLGKVIRLTSGGHAKVEDKPEVKKAGGVYYTPTYIVDYIVKNTVGKLVEDKKPEKVAELKIFDPACGSGSFLIGAYQYLLDWYLHWYSENEPEKHAKGRSPKIFKAQGNVWRLTTTERKRILLNDIYGVDIDPQAVEVTKLSLLLKVLEEESAETLGKNWEMFHERVLPDLDSNIKCGNSLIGPDYFTGQLLPDEDEMRRVNPFDWNAEFPEIMKAGGFDTVIGNPPWGAEFSMEEKQYLMTKFSRVHKRTPDSFNYFLCNAYDLSREGSIIGMIIPNNFLFQHEYAKSRQFFTKNAHINEAINLGDGVFEVTAPSCIVLIRRVDLDAEEKRTWIADVRTLERKTLPQHLRSLSFGIVPAKDILSSPDCIIPMDKSSAQLVGKILKRWPTLLGDLCDEVAAGIGTGGDKVFRIEDKKARSLFIEKDILHPVMIGREMNAYHVPDRTGYSIIYSTKSISSKTHPKALQHLKPFQVKLAQKRETRKGLIPWWSLHWPRYPDLFGAPKIVLRQTANSLYAALDTKGYYCLNSIIIVRPKDKLICKYLIGLLNSRLLRWLYRSLTQEQNRIFAEVKPINLRKLPIHPVNFSDKSDKAKHDRMVALVERMLNLHERLAKAKAPDDKTKLQRQIDATVRQIDRLVYDLYGLTEDEIRIVEGDA